ncbi:acyl-CoA thioesterase [Rhizobium tumorigenes]|uniref:acyl-CoA thioesterase n=1 Tax=Rhizobium tumorigenes TaxID=2041385 RepID=UPI000DA95C04
MICPPVDRRQRPEPSLLSSSAPTFNLSITVSPADIDQQGHVNNSVYLQWVQEAVLGYWHHIAPIDARNDLVWVALAHHIRYRKPVLLGDPIHVLVTATHASGPRASFTTRVKHRDELCAEIESSWCCINAATRRPHRLAKEIIKTFLPA